MDPYVELDEELGRIFLFADWEPGIAQKCKTVLGYKWHPDYDRKPWSYPLRMQTCLHLREVWGRRMQIGPKLTAWARTEAAEHSRRRQLARLPDSSLERVAELYPGMWEAMSKRPYQRSGADFLASVRTGACLDEPGLGKTLVALAAILQADKWNGRHLVIAPKTAIESTWVHEVQKWTDGRAYGMPDGKINREYCLTDFLDDEDEGARFLIVHPNMIQIKLSRYCKRCEEWERDVPPQHYEADHSFTTIREKCDWPELFEEGYWDSIVADEAQNYMLKLRPSAGRKPHSQPQWAHGLRALIKATAPGGLRIPMTGTPFRGKEEHIFGILHWMDPVTYSSFWSWANAFLMVEDQEHNFAGDSHKVIGRLRPEKEEAFYDSLDSICLRRTRQEVRADLPAMDEQDVWVDMEGEHERQYKEFEAKGIAELESGVVEQLGVLSELTRLRQFSFGPMDVEYKEVRVKVEQTESLIRWCIQHVAPIPTHRIETRMKLTPIVNKSPKFQVLKAMLEQRGAYGEFEAPGRKFVVVSQWTSFIDAMYDEFQKMGVPAMRITGRVTGKKRTQAADDFRFNPDGPRILFLNTTAGGTSLTLDELCDEMFILDETWVRDDQVQVMGRINNRGQEIRPRTTWYIRTKGTVEEGLALKNIDQQEMQSRILDRRRGVEVALSVLRREGAS
jgi:SNF2 family DNA or RNA helicase